jgi:hypothetical protein
MSDVGLIIVGIILAVIGYCIERYTTGILSTLGKIALIVGVVIAIIGFVLLAVHLVGAELLILPQIQMLA